MIRVLWLLGLCVCVESVVEVLRPGMNPKKGLEIMFQRPECFDFLVQNEQGPQDTTRCGSSNCNFPNEVCFMSTLKNFNNLDQEEERCVPVPADCTRAAQSGTISTSIPSAGPAPGPAPGPQPGPTPVDPTEPEASSCAAPKKLGTKCDAAKPQKMYFYRSTRSRCYTLRYRGCGGNGNRYRTAKLCKAACLPKVSVPAHCNKKPRLTRVGAAVSGKPCKSNRFYFFAKNAQKCKATKGCPCTESATNPLTTPNRRKCKRTSKNAYQTLKQCKQGCNV